MSESFIGRYLPLDEFLNGDSFVILTQEWNVPVEDDIEAWLNSQSDWVSSESGEWTYAGESALENYRATVVNSETVLLFREVNSWLKYVLYLAIAATPIVLLSPSWMSVLCYWVLSLYLFADPNRPLDESSACQRTHEPINAIGVLYFGAIVAFSWLVAQDFNSMWLSAVVLLFGVGYAMSRLYSRNALPYQQNHFLNRVVGIPMDIGLAMAASIVILVLSGILSFMIVDLLEEWINAVEATESSRGLRSIISDLTTGRVTTKQEFLDLLNLIRDWTPPVILSVGFLNIMLLHQWALKVVEKKFSKFQNSGTFAQTERRSSIIRLGQVLIWSSVLFLIAGIGGNIVLFGFEPVWFFPDWLFSSQIAYLSPTDNPSAGLLIGLIYDVCEDAISTIPHLPHSLILLGVISSSSLLAVYPCLGILKFLTPIHLLSKVAESTALPGNTRRFPLVRKHANIETTRTAWFLGWPIVVLIPESRFKGLSEAEIEAEVESVASRRPSLGVSVHLLAALAALAPGGRIARDAVYATATPTPPDKFIPISSQSSSDPDRTNAQPAEHDDLGYNILGILWNGARNRLLILTLPLRLYYEPLRIPYR